jgi:hypothetical protein
MGYLHISNLYKDQAILIFKRCCALEKVHGTSAHVKFNDEEALTKKLTDASLTDITIYGEAYGGKEQGMRETYGDQLRFIVFDIQIGESWLAVKNADELTMQLGLEFVPWREISTDIAELDAERDRISEVGERRGCPGKLREGIVLRPVIELTLNNGERVIAKHKSDKFGETRTPRKIINGATVQVMQDAEAIALEWVTEMRLTHVLDKLPQATDITKTGSVVNAMVEDVYREGKGEIVESKPAQQAISKRTAALFKKRVCKV